VTVSSVVEATIAAQAFSSRESGFEITDWVNQYITTGENC
jgi:hypothetical protein